MTPIVRRLRPFTPAAEDPAALDERTVGRDAVLQLITDRLDSAARSANRAHTLVVGPRGSGKSHVIEVALHQVASRETSERLVVVRLDEDAVGISRIGDVLGAVCHSLGVSPSTDNAATKRVITDALQGRVLVLVAHNLDRIFDGLGVTGQQELRAWVETSGEVLLLATSPALFVGVRKRDRPWYNNFAVSHLEDLTLPEGRELLLRMAHAYGDNELAAFLASADGEARLKAVHALAGGSPRVWMILSECLTVEVLDDLVPAVEGLLEGLVPYYQQLLWGLSANEQRLVRALAEGPGAAATVAEIAAITGIEQRSAATTLGRLADLNWVKAEKAPDLDRRSSWYRLREPMVRHHFQYRAAPRQPLPMIVELLRALYEPRRRELELVTSDAGSNAERLFARSLSTDPRKFDYAWSFRNPGHLLVEARRWIAGGDADRRTPLAGAAIEATVVAAVEGRAAAQQVVTARDEPELASIMSVIVDVEAALETETAAEDRVLPLLEAVAPTLPRRDRAVVELVAAGWETVEGDVPDTTARFDAVMDLAPRDPNDPLAADIALALARRGVLVDHREERRTELQRLAPVLAEQRGSDDHPDVLSARWWAASCAFMNSQFETACVEFADLADDSERALGRSHPDTVAAKLGWAGALGASGDFGRARSELCQLAREYASADAASSNLRVEISVQAAFWAAVGGDTVTAVVELLDLLAHEPALIGRSRASARDYLAGILVSLDEAPSSTVDDSDEHFAHAIARAVGGDASSRVRLPDELRAVVDEITSSKSSR